MERALTTWLHEEGTHSQQDNDFFKNLKLPYTIYGCLLLLSHNAFQSEAWKDVFAATSLKATPRLYALLCQHMKVTHIAITKPIPLHNDVGNAQADENIIRSPTNFQPLHGDFGPSTAASPPTSQDFDAAFWVTAKQNGISQIWAPRWTMFSRGNISEKARILELASVRQAVDEGSESGEGCTAVDLYAGIGYFAFSYLKAGVRKVLCWDLNEWSCEGLRRGARANGWEAVDGQADHGRMGEARLIVHCESNELAASRVQRMRGALPPIRHVNCGLLPTSRGSWRTAMEVLDPNMGGWVHVHDNFAVAGIEGKAEEVRLAFQAMLAEKREGTVELEFVNRLKSYAPGVMHCVLDIYIPPHMSD